MLHISRSAISAMSVGGHSRRFLRVRATSGYPPKLTVKANRQALSPGAAAPRARMKF